MCNTFEMKPCLERIDKRHFVIIVCLFNRAEILIITLELSSQLPFLYQTKYVIVNEYEMETLFRVRPSDTLPNRDALAMSNMLNQRSNTGDAWAPLFDQSFQERGFEGITF